MEEASVTDILQDALMQKNEKTEQEPEKETTTVIGATDKMEIPDYISEVVMPVDPFVKVALLLPFSAKDYPVFVDIRLPGSTSIGKNAGTDFCPLRAIYFFL